MPPVYALELTFRGADTVVAFACPRCGQIMTPSPFGDDAEANEVAAQLAVEHCNKHCRCGASIPPNRIHCQDCWRADQTERDEKKFERATKVPEADYDGNPIYWEGHEGSMGDGYFESIDELRDICEENGQSMPPFVWACNQVELHIDVENILESAFQEHHEGARDMLQVGAEAELSILLLAWCARQNIQSWQTDYRRAIVLEQEEGTDVGSRNEEYPVEEVHPEGDHRSNGINLDATSSTRSD